jgi:putative flippase GtrA
MIRRELFGFGLVGGIGFVIDFAIFNFLLWLGVLPALANFVSVSLAGAAVFTGNLRVSFRHVVVGSKTRAISRFVLVTVLTVLINTLLVWAAFTALGPGDWVRDNLVKLTIVALLMVGRFLAMKFFIYVQ